MFLKGSVCFGLLFGVQSFDCGGDSDSEGIPFPAQVHCKFSLCVRVETARVVVNKLVKLVST